MAENKIKTKAKEFWEKNGDAILGGALLAGSTVIGYNVGKYITMAKISYGIQRTWDATPELKQQMLDGIHKVMELDKK